MTYAVNITDTAPRGLARLVAKFGRVRASRNERVHTRRTALAMSEEALIHAQMCYRRMRYRHMAG